MVSPEHYRVSGEVARGGMGRILLAEDRRLRRPVALKELHAAGAAEGRFAREALLTARLQHPSIVPVYEAGRWPGGAPFYAMKFLSGRSLEAVIRECGSFAERLALLPHVIAVAEAVAYAHSEQIVHRDLKPANVLVGPFGETVVVDWGLAKDLASPDPDEGTAGSLAGQGHTVQGVVMGTPAFMPPEQARGQPADERSDVYALGAILYHVLAGAPPRSGSTVREVLEEATSRPARPLEDVAPDVPAELGAIVRKAMALDPRERYPTARELASDLRRFQTGQLVSVHRYSMLDLLRRWLHRHRAAVTVAAVLSVGLIASVVAGFIGVRRQARVAEEERDRARMEARKAEQIAGFVQGMLSSADPRVQGRSVTVARVLDEAAGRVGRELAGQPDVEAGVRTTLGNTYAGLGLLEPAEAQFRAALEIQSRLHRSEHRDIAVALARLASAQSDRGELEEAEKLHREAIAMLERLGLGESADVTAVKGDLAVLLNQKGDLVGAEKLHREVLDLERRQGDEAAVANSLHNLAVVLGQKGDSAQAEALHREALSLIRRLRGLEHPDVAAAMSALASILEARGLYAESEALYRDTLALRRKLLGEDHPDTMWTLYNYAYFLSQRGDQDGAAQAASEVLRRRGGSLPEGHPLIPAAQQVLGRARIAQGRPREAEPILRESLALRRRSLPPGHWLVASAESQLGECLAALGRRAEARRLLTTAYHTLRERLGEGHEQTALARARLSALDAARAGAASSAATSPVPPR